MEPNITLSDVVSECHRIKDLKDTTFSQKSPPTNKKSGVVNQILQNGIFIHPPDLHLLVGFAVNDNLCVNTVKKEIIGNCVAMQGKSDLIRKLALFK
ncbi:hypothetical protein ACTXT7_009798 [Hymenolepis weldensis]